MSLSAPAGTPPAPAPAGPPPPTSEQVNQANASQASADQQNRERDGANEATRTANTDATNQRGNATTERLEAQREQAALDERRARGEVLPPEQERAQAENVQRQNDEASAAEAGAADSQRRADEATNNALRENEESRVAQEQANAASRAAGKPEPYAGVNETARAEDTRIRADQQTQRRDAEVAEANAANADVAQQQKDAAAKDEHARNLQAGIDEKRQRGEAVPQADVDAANRAQQDTLQREERLKSSRQGAEAANQQAVDANIQATRQQNDANTAATQAGKPPPYEKAQEKGVAEDSRLKAEQQKLRTGQAQSDAHRADANAVDAERGAATQRQEANTRQAELQRRERSGQPVSAQERDEVRRLDQQARTSESNAAVQRGQANTARTVAYDASNAAIASQRTANADARNAGQTNPYEHAERVTNADDAGSLSTGAQEQLYGGRAGVVSTEQAREYDRVSIERATQAGPAAGAQELDRQLAQNTDPAQQRELLRVTQPQVDHIQRSLPTLPEDQQDKVFASLGNISRSTHTSLSADATDQAGPGPLNGLMNTAADVRSTRLDRLMQPPNDASDPDVQLKYSQQLAQATEGNTSPVFQKRLLERAAPHIETIGRTYETTSVGTPLPTDQLKETVRNLSIVADRVGPDNTRIMASAMARGLNENRNDLYTQGDVGEAIRAAMMGENGPTTGSAFGVQLAQEATAQGLTNADGIAAGATEALEETLNDYQAARANTQRLENELGTMLEGFGATATEAQRNQAIANFYSAHKAEFDRVEEAANRLAPMAEGVSQLAGSPENSDLGDLQEQSQRLMGDLGTLGHTNRGQQLLADAATRQAQGHRTLLTDVPAVGAELGKKSATDLQSMGLVPENFQGGAVGYRAQVSGEMYRATNDLTSQMVASGRNADAYRLTVSTLEQNQELNGMSPDQVQKAKQSFDNIFNSKDEEKIATGVKNVLTMTSPLAMPAGTGNSGPLYDNSALKGFALANTAYSSFVAFDKAMDSGEVKDYLAGSSAGMQAISDGMGMLGSAYKNSTSQSRLAQVGGVANDYAFGFKALGKAAGVLGVAGGFMDVQEALDKRDPSKAGVAALSTIAGVAALFTTGPVGVGLGLAALGAGFALNRYRDVRGDSIREEDQFRFLKDLGYRPDVASKLANQTGEGIGIGGLLQDMGRRSGLSGTALRDHLNQMTPAQLNALDESIEYWGSASEQRERYDSREASFHRLIDQYTLHGKQIPETELIRLHERLRSTGVLP